MITYIEIEVDMRQRIFSFLQKMGRSFMLPIAVLPIAGIFLGIGSSFTNEATIVSLHLETVLKEGQFLYNFLLLMKQAGSVLFDNLPLIFAVSVSLGMAKQRKEVSALSAILAFFVMHATINGLLCIDGSIQNGVVANTVLEGTITSECGLLSLEMGVFGGFIVGLGVSSLHNRFYQIQLPKAISFFEGERFVPIVCSVSYFFVGILMYFIWPNIQQAIYNLGHIINELGYFGIFIYGVIKRALVPFGLHHVWYTPFFQTALGGVEKVNGVSITGAQNIIFAQLSDPSVQHFSYNAAKYFTGEYIFMMFGLPGACLAMYQCSNPESKKKVGSLLLSAALTSFLTGITEPIEFSFIFAAPILFVCHVILAASCFVVANILQVAIGFTFSAGFIDFFMFGIIQGNSKTNWIFVVIAGIIYFFLYYFVFKFMIQKMDLKTPGRDESIKVFDKKKYDFSFDKSLIDPRSQLIVRGLGGRNNFYDLDCCITRLRMSVHDDSLIDEGLLKQSGAAAIMKQSGAIQIIYGPQASNIKTKLDEYLNDVPQAYDNESEDISLKQNEVFDLYCLVDGEVLPIEQASDTMFSHKLMGDGVMIRPRNGIVVAPCDGVISMIYPAKHALGITIDDQTEILIHFGIDTVKLNGKGFELLVSMNQKVKAGDILWNADLKYIQTHAIDDSIMVVFTKKSDQAKLEMSYGKKNRMDVMVKVKA